MLWETHIRITNEVLHKLGIPMSSEETALLREGLVIPDKWKDYPHHYGKSSSIRKYIMEARRFFLNGDLPNAYFSLGVALHYVQDSYTSLTSRSRHHLQWEEQIERSFLVDDLQKLVTWAFRNHEDQREEYAEIMGFLSNEIDGKEDTFELATLRDHEPILSWNRPWGAPEVDLNFAFRASLSIAKSVLSSRTCPKLQTELKQVLAEHETMLRKTETIYADKIVELIRKRDELKKKRKSGIFSTIKSYFSTFLSKIYNRWMESKIDEYEQQEHLRKIARTYQRVAKAIVAPHSDWYNITIPQIDINIVEKELLPIQEASRFFGTHESIIRYLIEKGKISCYDARKKELIRRSEVREVLRI